MQYIYFITHPEVVIDPDIAVTDWSLSELGLLRIQSLLRQSWVDDITSLYCSTEKKAEDGAEVVASALDLSMVQLDTLGENDRSATGYLPSAEFEQVADQFFSEPDVSTRGWETARAAQSRIVGAVRKIIDEDSSTGSIAIISHGAVGALLYCYLASCNIDRKYDQPGAGGGHYFAFERQSRALVHGWRQIDSL